MRSFFAVTLRRIVLAIVALVGLASAGAAHGGSPEEVLQSEFGLVRLSSTVWGLPLEAALKEKFAQLPPLRESILATEKELDDRIEQNHHQWQETAPLVETLKKGLAQLGTSDPGRPALQAKLLGLEQSATEPAHLSMRPEVRRKLVAVSRDRSLLQITLLQIRTTAAQLAKEYDQLPRKGEISALLRKLEGQRLGPQRDYVAEVKRLGDYDRIAFNSWLPTYQQAGQIRLTVVVNEQAPVTFTWSEETDGMPLLPASVVETAGLSIPLDAPVRKLVLEKRSIDVRELRISSIRLGRHVQKDVTAWLLPPEAEDLGARLPRRALEGLRIHLEPERLRLTVIE